MLASGDCLVLAAGDVRVVVDVAAGGRLSSLIVGDSELIWSGPDGGGDSDPMVWGLYPMVPFAGRILRGEFTFGAVDYALPQNHEGNAIHGFGFLSPWTRVDDTSISFEFVDPWPFAGRVTQRYELSAERLTLEMTVEADDEQPMGIGWHPWFRHSTAAGTAELRVPALSMYERDAQGMPGDLIAAPPGPWDDCFTNLTDVPSITWGDLMVRLDSNLDHWTVFNERDYGFCIEPQSGPPNEINHNPRVLSAGETMTASFTLTFVRGIYSETIL